MDSRSRKATKNKLSTEIIAALTTDGGGRRGGAEKVTRRYEFSAAADHSSPDSVVFVYQDSWSKRLLYHRPSGFFPRMKNETGEKVKWKSSPPGLVGRTKSGSVLPDAADVILMAAECARK